MPQPASAQRTISPWRHFTAIIDRLDVLVELHMDGLSPEVPDEQDPLRNARDQHLEHGLVEIVSILASQ